MNERNAALSRRDFQRILALGLASTTLPGFAVAEEIAKTVAKTAGPIRLHFNENPAGVSPAGRRALASLLDVAWQYPDEPYRGLHADLAALHGVDRDRILLGNGSSEILALAAETFTGPGRPLVVADPTYDAMAEYAEPMSAEVKRIPLDGAHAHDLGRMFEASGGAGLLYICNPNNPTGTITPKAHVREAIEKAPQDLVIVVDEAYVHYVFSDDYESVVPMLGSHPNLVVLRTFSKVFGMAGLRCGYAIGQPFVIEPMDARQSRNNLNIAALLAARASLSETAWVAESKKRNADTRAMVFRELETLGFSCTKSETNFFMIDIGHDTRPIAKAMKERGILVGRPFPPMTDFLRVSIGTREQMERFVEAFREVVKS